MEEREDKTQEKQNHKPKNRQEELKMINELYGGKFLSFCTQNPRLNAVLNKESGVLFGILEQYYPVSHYPNLYADKGLKKEDNANEFIDEVLSFVPKTAMTRKEETNRIEKLYGHDFKEFCTQNETLSVILSTPGRLLEILEKHFPPNKHLYADICSQERVGNFVEFICASLPKSVEKDLFNIYTPAEELFAKAGYKLYKCETEAEIQSFRHYYLKDGGRPTPIYVEGTDPERHDGEELCTFNGGRLKDCFVWFAVHQNADKLKRQDFTNPKRQDEYGTSVISIQVGRKLGMMSIKNRYNHTVEGCDCTFNNNLDNIYPGLTRAFENEYHLGEIVPDKKKNFSMDNYKLINDKYYYYNQEANGIYYCDNNIIIEKGEIKTFDRSRYILADYFLIDLKENKITIYDDNIPDCFVDSIGEISQIKREGNKIFVTPKPEQEGFPKKIIEIEIDDKNRIISVTNENITECGDNFLVGITELKSLNVPNLKKCGDYFIGGVTRLDKLSLPNLEECGGCFAFGNEYGLKSVELPNLKKCGDGFLYYNMSLTELCLKNLEECGDYFLESNKIMTTATLPRLRECGDRFMEKNRVITNIDFASLTTCGDWFFAENRFATRANMPLLTQCGDGFLLGNELLTSLELPQLTQCGEYFMEVNSSLETLNLNCLESCKKGFLAENKTLKSLDLPKIERWEDPNFADRLYLTEETKTRIKTIEESKTADELTLG